MSREPLIAGRPVAEFEPQEYADYVSAMHEVRSRGSRTAKPESPAPGLTLSRTKKGVLSVRRAKAKRAFDYLTRSELAALAKAVGATQAEVWNFFKTKDYIIAGDRLEAERIYADIKEIPWTYK